jgi:hypothetical protein
VTKQLCAALVLGLGTLLLGGRAGGEDKPAVKEVTIAEEQKAVFYPTDGTTASGKLLKLDGTSVSCVVKGKKYKHASNLFKAVQVKDGTLIYVPAQKAFVRIEPVKVVNNSGEKVTFTLTAAQTFLGTEVVLVDERTKNNLEVGVTALADLLGGGGGGAPQKPTTEWTIEPGKTLDVKLGNLPLYSNQVRFTLKNDHGFTRHARENARLGSEFVVALEKADVHTPVLAKLGDWKVDQDVTYTVVKGREPARAVTVPIESFDKKKIVRYETYYYEGRDYEYTKQENGGIATASADVENPTDKPLAVEVTLEFSFAHLLLSHAQVTSKLDLPAKSKGLVRMEVNTKGFFNNRNVTGVKVIDIITTPN